MFVEHKEVGEVIEQPAGITTLSQAIRIGSKLRPKCTGQMFKNGGSCALGAAYEALYGYPGDCPSSDVPRLYAIFDRVPKPAIASFMETIGTSKNDAGWTREQIADWLEERGY